MWLLSLMVVIHRTHWWLPAACCCFRFDEHGASTTGRPSSDRRRDHQAWWEGLGDDPRFKPDSTGPWFLFNNMRRRLFCLRFGCLRYVKAELVNDSAILA